MAEPKTKTSRKREAFSIVPASEVGQLQGVKESLLEPSEFYAVKVLHDRSGGFAGFDVKPYDPESEDA